MKKIIELGEHYVSDFLENSCSIAKSKYSLDLYLDEKIGAVRLKDLAPPESMWGKYWYRSGINNSMVQELKNLVEEVVSRTKVKTGDIWLDIACNDGTLFKFIPEGVIKIGIDPCDDSYYKESSKLADCVVQDYFSISAWNKNTYNDKKCNIITTIAMFYDLDDPHSFIEDIKKILYENGTWIIQLSYTPLMIEQMAFDNVCHEHIYYYCLTSLKKLFEMHDLKIVDANLNDTNGGSIRVYIQHKNSSLNSFGSAPLRDVCNYRIKSMLEYEKNYFDLTDVELWKSFENKLQKLKQDVTSFIRSEKTKGKKIYGYGASTKGNTLLQYFGLTNDDITAIAEKSEYKFGLKTVGTNIPIISEEQMRKEKPDYLLILPWCFISEFIQREKDFLNNGGKFIVPCPKFEIIGKS